MAKNFIVEIGDEAGNSCRIAITTSGIFDYGGWRTLDKGYISRNSGATVHANSNGTLGYHLQLLGGANSYGIQLNDWTYFGGLNNGNGTGFLQDVWALNLRKGRISWAILP